MDVDTGGLFIRRDVLGLLAPSSGYQANCCRLLLFTAVPGRRHRRRRASVERSDSPILQLNLYRVLYLAIIQSPGMRLTFLPPLVSINLSIAWCICSVSLGCPGELW